MVWITLDTVHLYSTVPVPQYSTAVHLEPGLVSTLTLQDVVMVSRQSVKIVNKVRSSKVVKLQII